MPKRPLALLFLPLLTGAAVFADLPVGPVYPDRFPTLEIAVEPPGLDPQALSAIQAEELELLEDGVTTSGALEVRPFGATERGIALVVAIDASGTMTGKPLAELKQALAGLVEEIRPQDRLALVSFADEFRQEMEFTSDSQQLREVIEGIEARGRITELFKALFKSLELFDEPGLPARRRLVVVSDGKDEGEAYRIEDVIEKARSLSVPVDGIGLTRIDPKYLSQLERLADLSGGFYARASEAADLERRFDDWMERLQATPVASFEAQRLNADGQPHRVGVRWRAEGRVLEGDVQVLMPAPPPPPPPSDEPDEGPGESEDLRPEQWLGVPRTALLVGGLAVFALLLLALWLLRRARRAARIGKEASDLEQESPESTDAGPPVEAPGLMVTEAPEESEEAPSTAARPRRKTQLRTPFAAPADGRPAALLKGIEGALEDKAFGIEEDPFWIGSDEANQLPIDGDDYVSGHHACIRFHEGSLLLYDNGSTNGTFLNEERLEKTPRTLARGDRVRCGRTTFVILAPPDEGASEGATRDDPMR